MTSTELLPEYRPAWEIDTGWEIRTEDGTWLRVDARFYYDCIDPDKEANGLQDVVVLHLGDESECKQWASDLVMTRKPPAVSELAGSTVDYCATCARWVAHTAGPHPHTAAPV